MAQQQHAPSEHHIIPYKVLTRVCIALLILTALTVICARLDLGLFATPVAFLIAITKAMLVMAFFMGLKYDAVSNRLIFATGFIFLLLFFFFSALDIWTRVFQGNTL